MSEPTVSIPGPGPDVSGAEVAAGRRLFTWSTVSGVCTGLAVLAAVGGSTALVVQALRPSPPVGVAVAPVIRMPGAPTSGAHRSSRPAVGTLAGLGALPGPGLLGTTRVALVPTLSGIFLPPAAPAPRAAAPVVLLAASVSTSGATSPSLRPALTGAGSGTASTASTGPNGSTSPGGAQQGRHGSGTPGHRRPGHAGRSAVSGAVAAPALRTGTSGTSSTGGASPHASGRWRPGARTGSPARHGRGPDHHHGEHFTSD